MMLRWTRDLVHAVERTLDGHEDGPLTVRVLLLELYERRHKGALFQKHPFDSWPVAISGIAMSLIVEYSADGLALAVTGCLPSHRKHKRFLGRVTSAGGLLSAEVSGVDECRDYVRSAVADSYALPRF